MPLVRRGRESLSRALASLRHRNYRLLFIGTSLSHVGDFVQAMAQSWLVWKMTGSPFLLGVVGFCQAVPRLLLGAVGGAIVDRLERRRLMLWTQGLAMAQAFSFWALVYFDLIQFWHVLVLVLFLGTVNSLNQTARHSLINGLVPREDLMNAIALNSSVANFAKIIGPSFGGVLISIIGVAGCLFVNAVSFFAIIVTLVVMDFSTARGKTKEEATFWQEVAEGYRFRAWPAPAFLDYSINLWHRSGRVALFALSAGVRHRCIACRAIDFRVAAGGAWNWRCYRWTRDCLLDQVAPAHAFCRDERLCLFPGSDSIFIFSFPSSIHDVSGPGRRQQYCHSLRVQRHCPDGDSAPFIGPNPQSIFHG